MIKRYIEDIISLIDEKKGENIELFDLKDSDYFVDYVIIATTLAQKHGYSLLDYIKEYLKKIDEKILHIDSSDEWIVIDTGEILIHLMSAEYRVKYNIEEFLTEYKNKKEV